MFELRCVFDTAASTLMGFGVVRVGFATWEYLDVG